MYKTIITIVCVLLLLCGSLTGSVGAYPAVVTYSVDGIDLDTGEIEQDRTLLWLLMGSSIDELLQPPVPSADFSPSVDLSFRLDLASQDIPSPWLMLGDDVQIAVVQDRSFDELLFAGGLSFAGIPPEIPIDQNSVLVAWTAENRYFKLGHFHSLPDFQLAFDIEEIPIPEPSALLLLGAGLLGFLGLARRHKLLLLLVVVLTLVTILNAQPLYAEDLIRIQKAGPGSGTVFAGTETCDAACDGLSFAYDEGTAILLKAVADEGSWFDRWVTPEGSTLSRTFTPQPGDTVVAVFATELPPSGGSVSIAEGAVTVTIPEGAVDGPISVSLTEVLFAPSEFSKAYDIRVYTPEGTPVTQFDPALTITMTYDPEATSGTFVYSPVMYYYDEATGQWVALPSIVDYDAYTVTAATTHLTIFQLTSDCPSGSCQVSLSAPQDGNRTNDPTPTYSWKRETFDCERYCLEILQTDVGDYRLIGKKEEDCYEVSVLLSEGKCSATSCEVTPGAYLDDNNEYNWNSLPEGSYRWRVKTWEPTGEDDFELPTGEVVKKGYGAWSAPGSFTIDTTPPTPGNGGALGVELKDNGVKLSWVAATDGYTEQSALEYLIYYSTSDNLNEPETIDTNGTLVPPEDVEILHDDEVPSNFKATIDNDLFSEPKYYLNVLVQDGAGNTAVYDAQLVTFADVCQVTSSADSGAGTLRQVLAEAGTNNCTTMTFADGISQINLQTELEITSGTLTIDGGTGVTIKAVDYYGTARVFSVGSGANVTFLGLDITQGGPYLNAGGGIYNQGTIIIGSGTTVRDNISDVSGGGIYNYGGTVTVADGGAVSGNNADYAAGISNIDGVITVENGAAISNNDEGGAIRNFSGIVTISGTISGNSASEGGGIYTSNGTVTITSTGRVINNSAANEGGGIYQDGGTVSGASSSTVYGNTADDCPDYYSVGEGCLLPRFIDNGDGTVTDLKTGLVWLKNANCFGQETWIDARTEAENLSTGQCGLTDGSSSGTWHLPTRSQLRYLTDTPETNPSLPAGHPFSSVISDEYWTSDGPTYPDRFVYSVDVTDGSSPVYWVMDTVPPAYAWPVKSPDLTITEAWIGGYAETYVTATIQNIGSVDAGAFTVRLNALGDSPYGSVEVPVSGLGAGEETEITFHNADELGLCNSSDCLGEIIVDPDNMIQESDEGNNTFTAHAAL